MNTTTPHPPQPRFETVRIPRQRRLAYPLIRMLSTCLIALTLDASAATLITNGDLDGPATTHSLMPSGWSNISQGTTDTVGAAGHPFASFDGIGSHPYAASPNGGTFAWSADNVGPPTATQPEGLRQTVSGLSIGQVYEIRLEFTNLALYDDAGNIATNAFLAGQNYNSTGRWLITLAGTIIGSTPTVNPFPTTGTQIWSVYSQTFIATSASATLDIVSDRVSGAGTHVGMGIDGISVDIVPEPNAVMLVLIATTALSMRRHRSHAEHA